nr:Alpha/beta hydrolase family [uncultured bacterium]
MTNAVVSSRIEQVVDAFLTPSPPRQRLPLALPGGRTLHIDTPVGEVALMRAGTGPTVLLLHGWEGQASDMAAFTEPLLDAGFTVVAMDLPAHGASSGRQTPIPESAVALRTVADVLGSLHAVITHSVGSPVLVEALYAGMSAQRVVLLAAPAYYEHYARGFAAAAGLDERETETMLKLLRENKGIDVTEISLPARARHLNQPALFIHSGDDRIVPIKDSIDSASAWPGARHLRVDGLGHRRILTDTDVVNNAIDFVVSQ